MRWHIVNEQGEVWHKRRHVWQWFYDSANPGWKTKGGAQRALTRLQGRWPKEFEGARIEC